MYIYLMYIYLPTYACTCIHSQPLQPGEVVQHSCCYLSQLIEVEVAVRGDNKIVRGEEEEGRGGGGGGERELIA